MQLLVRNDWGTRKPACCVTCWLHCEHTVEQAHSLQADSPFRAPIADDQSSMAEISASFSARVCRQHLVLWAAVLVLAFFTLGFSAGRSSTASNMKSLFRSRTTAGPLPPEALLDALSLQPSAGAAALPFKYTKDPKRRAARLLPDQLGPWRDYAAARWASRLWLLATSAASVARFFHQRCFQCFSLLMRVAAG